MNQLAKHHFMREGILTVGAEPKALFEYIVASNGIFLYAGNEVFSATIPIVSITEKTRQIRGLQTVWPQIRLPNGTRVPADLLKRMVSLSRRAMPNEILFHLTWQANEWVLITPAQRTGPTSATPLEDNIYVPIEIHSHNSMASVFSSTDDRDETGLRIYGVLGRVDKQVVEFRLRISIYGHYSVLPYQLVFEPIEGVTNG